jgi:hypothetical protein
MEEVLNSAALWLVLIYEWANKGCSIMALAKGAFFLSGYHFNFELNLVCSFLKNVDVI